MELIVDVVLGGLGYLVVKAFNRLFKTKITFGDSGYVVTGFLFLVAAIALFIILFGWLRR